MGGAAGPRRWLGRIFWGNLLQEVGSCTEPIACACAWVLFVSAPLLSFLHASPTPSMCVPCGPRLLVACVCVSDQNATRVRLRMSLCKHSSATDKCKKSTVESPFTRRTTTKIAPAAATQRSQTCDRPIQPTTLAAFRCVCLHRACVAPCLVAPGTRRTTAPTEGPCFGQKESAVWPLLQTQTRPVR